MLCPSDLLDSFRWTPPEQSVTTKVCAMELSRCTTFRRALLRRTASKRTAKHAPDPGGRARKAHTHSSQS